MIVMVCVDNQNGMMFNHRRQSQDRGCGDECAKLPVTTTESSG